MIDFNKLLTPEVRERIERIEVHKQKIQNIPLDEFIKIVKYNHKNCGVVLHRYKEGDPVYDAEMYYTLIPEMIRRLEGKK